jgi:hypothetical protein
MEQRDPRYQAHEAAPFRPGTRRTSHGHRAASRRPNWGAFLGALVARLPTTRVRRRPGHPRRKSLRGEATQTRPHLVCPRGTGPARRRARASVLQAAAQTPKGRRTASRTAGTAWSRVSAQVAAASTRPVASALTVRGPASSGDQSPASTSAGAFPSSCERGRTNQRRIPNSLYEPARSATINAIQCNLAATASGVARSRVRYRRALARAIPRSPASRSIPRWSVSTGQVRSGIGLDPGAAVSLIPGLGFCERLLSHPGSGGFLQHCADDPEIQPLDGLQTLGQQADLLRDTQKPHRLRCRRATVERFLNGSETELAHTPYCIHIRAERQALAAGIREMPAGAPLRAP